MSEQIKALETKLQKILEELESIYQHEETYDREVYDAMLMIEGAIESLSQPI